MRGEDAGNERRRHAVAKITLADVLCSEKRPTGAPLSRTLLDVIFEDQNPNANNRKTWKSFKDRIRLRQTGGGGWTSAVHVPASDIPMKHPSQKHMFRQESARLPMARDNEESTWSKNSPTKKSPRNRGPRMSKLSSTRFTKVRFNLEDDEDEDGEGEIDSAPQHVTCTRLAAALADEREQSAAKAAEEDEREEAEESPTEGDEKAAAAPVRMSLMDLLEETDREMGIEGTTYGAEEEEEEYEDDDEDGEGNLHHHGEEFTCCVCMVRHKGAAFMPCGHTFCRLCSRELWVSRGNCPICNGFVSEILDIF